MQSSSSGRTKTSVHHEMNIIGIFVLLVLFNSVFTYLHPAFSVSRAYLPFKQSNPHVLTRTIGRDTQKLHRLFGVPRLFRWLVNLFPGTLESAHLVNFKPTDKKISLSNKFGPKGQVYKSVVDNFYLDMNGIIHLCTHANKPGLIPCNERDMFKSIFIYTDNLFKYIKPQNKLVLAIDGVAPRAKRNQQRARRYRAAEERNEIIQAFIAKEGRVPTTSEAFDSGCITPGTIFMHRLSIAFRSWIEYKRTTDNFWRDSPATIVYSGADVPGEGEHKIMDMIREDQSKRDPASNKLVHCMYGQDADLIMLSMVTHERFFLLREKVYYGKKKANATITGDAGRKGFRASAFDVLDINTVRSMLNSYFESVKCYFNSTEVVIKKSPKSPKSSDKSTIWINPCWYNNSPKQLSSNASVGEVVYDLERIVDDFVLLSFLVGNDFLPGLPHFDISDGCMELIMDSYHRLLPSLGGYITNKSHIHLNRLELLIAELARREPLYFQHRGISEVIPEFETDEYKNFYYLTKFNISYDDKPALNKVIQSYLESFFWVAEYYHNGCCSWEWYYPYLYAPLASDLKDLSSHSIRFTKGSPVSPFFQLLTVLPPSSKLMPRAFQRLMINSGEKISPFYPAFFNVDQNGKKAVWEGVVQIPFINDTILNEELTKVGGLYAGLSADLIKLDQVGQDHYYHPMKRNSGSRLFL